MGKITSKLTVGFEIEAVRVDGRYMSALTTTGANYTRDKSVKFADGSCISPKGGHEFISRPYSVEVISDQDGQNLSVGADVLKNDLRLLLSSATEVNKTCGIHVHLGRPSKTKLSHWEPERVRTFLAIGQILEKQLFNVCDHSRWNNPQCKTIRQSYTQDELTSFYPVGEAVAWKYSNPKRYCWLNLIETVRQAPPVTDSFRNTRDGSTNTIEIRMLGNTNDFNYVFDWIQMWLRIASFVAYIPTSLTILHARNQTFKNDLNKLSAHRQRLFGDVQALEDELSMSQIASLPHPSTALEVA